MRSRSPLRASLSRRRRTLAKHLPAALTGDSLAVHQARVASRRLRETLPVVGADLAREDVAKVRRRMRRLTRVLGPVRELEVALGMTESAAAGRTSSGAASRGAGANGGGSSGTASTGAASIGAAPPGAVSPGAVSTGAGANGAARATTRKDTQAGRERLQLALRRDLDRARARLTRGLDADKIARWLDQIRGLEETLADLRAPTAWRRELADRLERRTARLQSALDEAGVLFVAERLHEVRIALKRLRYALELAGELGLASTAAAVRGLKSVQDILGALHDLDVLMGYAAASAEQPGVDRVTRASLLALHGALDLDRHSLHAQFLAQRPALLRLHDRALDVAARARTRRAPRAGVRAGGKRAADKRAADKSIAARHVADEHGAGKGAAGKRVAGREAATRQAAGRQAAGREAVTR